MFTYNSIHTYIVTDTYTVLMQFNFGLFVRLCTVSPKQLKTMASFIFVFVLQYFIYLVVLSIDTPNCGTVCFLVFAIFTLYCLFKSNE